MTAIDWIIVAILVGSIITGMAQGFIRSAFSLGGLLLGLILAAWNYPRIATLLHPSQQSEGTMNALAFVIIAIGVTVICALTGALLAKAFKKMGLGCLDALAGAIFGFFQGALFVTVWILVTMAFFPEAEWLTQSRLPKYFFGACHLSTRVTPDSLSKLVREDLNRLERVSPEWMHPPEPAR